MGWMGEVVDRRSLMGVPGAGAVANPRRRRAGRTGPDRGIGDALPAAGAEVVTAALVDRLHTSSAELLALLTEVAAGLPADPDGQVRSVTSAEEGELRAAGSLRVSMPPLAGRASTAAVRADTTIRAGARTVGEVAELLGVSPGRIRQRLAARTLLGFHTTDGWRIPGFLFDPAGELPGLSTVLTALPADVHPVAVEAFLTRPHHELVVDGEVVSPREWLRGGGDPQTVAAAAGAAYRLP